MNPAISDFLVDESHGHDEWDKPTLWHHVSSYDRSRLPDRSQDIAFVSKSDFLEWNPWIKVKKLKHW